MKELMQQIYDILSQYDYSEDVNIVTGSFAEAKETLSERPLKSCWGEPPSEEDKQDQETFLSLLEQLYKIADYEGQYTEECSNSDSYTYYTFKSKESEERYAFLTTYNSWGDANTSNGVYKVKATPTIQYSIIEE